MTKKIEPVIYENGVQLFFRGIFLGIPVYSKAIIDNKTVMRSNDKTRR